MARSCTGTNCRCVGPTLLDRCIAIRQYVRPEDVRHLIRVVPRHALPAGYSRAAEIARILKRGYASGWLRYIPDPEHCDRWCRPSETLRRGGGDCDDLAILAASFARAMRVQAWVVVGKLCYGGQCDGHAWVEGIDEVGHFFLEATNGALRRDGLPWQYGRHLLLTPEGCSVAGDSTTPQMQSVAAVVNASWTYALDCA